RGTSVEELVVGFPNASGGEGQVLVFEISSSKQLVEAVTLQLPDPLSGDRFGKSLARLENSSQFGPVDKDDFLVSAPGRRNPTGAVVGLVSLFVPELIPNGGIALLSSISDVEVNNEFGADIATHSLNGITKVYVGAPMDDVINRGTDTGSVKVLSLSLGGFVLEQNLVGNRAHDQYGFSVDATPGVLAVSAIAAKDQADRIARGAVYRYRVGAAGIQQYDAHIGELNEHGMRIGYSIALTNDISLDGVPETLAGTNADPLSTAPLSVKTSRRAKILQQEVGARGHGGFFTLVPMDSQRQDFDLRTAVAAGDFTGDDIDEAVIVRAGSSGSVEVHMFAGTLLHGRSTGMSMVAQVSRTGRIYIDVTDAFGSTPFSIVVSDRAVEVPFMFDSVEHLACVDLSRVTNHSTYVANFEGDFSLDIPTVYTPPMTLDTANLVFQSVAYDFGTGELRTSNAITLVLPIQ
ncbi:MAG: hypothetical protein KDD70_18710, partial [Bdellovibrionales bacterium]|nr:hypothetical protein [Bdellovibrionales bacterium]